MSHLKEIAGFLNHIGDPIIIVNETSELIYANSACEKLFGYPENSMAGMTIRQLMAPSSGTNHENWVKKFIETKAEARDMMTRGDLLCLSQSGTTFNARISIATAVINGTVCGVGTIQDFTALKKEIEHLETSSYQDSLTGLYNRRYLDKIIDPRSRILKTWSRIGVIYFDLDQFKPVNDQYGHDIGDSVLRAVSNRMKSCIRFDDLVFRIGGDEFLVFLNLSDVVNAMDTMKRISKTIHKVVTAPIQTEHFNVRIGLSAGYGLYPDHADDLDALIQLTDTAMYAAKKAGKDDEVVQNT